MNHLITQWLPKSFQSVSTEIKDVRRVTKHGAKNRQGYVLLYVPFILSRSSLFNLFSFVIPSLFSHISNELLLSVYKTEIEKEKLNSKIKLLTKKLEETRAEVDALEKKYDEGTNEIEKQRASRSKILARKYEETLHTFLPSGYLVFGAMLINIITCVMVFNSDQEMLQNFIFELLAPVSADASFVTTICFCLYFW